VDYQAHYCRVDAKGNPISEMGMKKFTANNLKEAMQTARMIVSVENRQIKRWKFVLVQVIEMRTIFLWAIKKTKK